MYGPVLIKHAHDLTDIFSLIETNRIMRWGNDVYPPWFTRAVLDTVVAT